VRMRLSVEVLLSWVCRTHTRTLPGCSQFQFRRLTLAPRYVIVADGGTGNSGHVDFETEIPGIVSVTYDYNTSQIFS
jgi:hypothetical protein